MPDGSDQLAAETQWLRGEMTGSPLATLIEGQISSSQLISNAQRVENVLKSAEVTKFLAVLEEYNKTDNYKGRNKSRFLLSPYLLHVLRAVEARRANFATMPVLDRPPAEVRAHLEGVSAKSKELANLLRKAPQPHVVIAARSAKWDSLSPVRANNPRFR
jgi:hypothetical protein